MMRVLLILSVIVAAGAGTLFAQTHSSEVESLSAIIGAADAGEQISRGKYLALVGNCAGCHTARGGIAFAGGRAIETPFGSVASSNLTSDAKTGLGNWTPDDFWRAMHFGTSKSGRLLYPAFPYPNYTKVARADSDALFAYFKTLPPIVQANREHALRFPYNNQFLLAIWRALYFRPGVFQPEAKQSAEWNRGAYLVQGLGHCNACHASRDKLGGLDQKDDLAGGMMPMSNWYASSLTADAGTGLGKWKKQQIAGLLKTGVSERGAAFGPMSEIIYKSLQYLSSSDVQTIAEYLVSLPPTQSVAKASVESLPKVQMAQVMEWGVMLYKKHCVECHGETGAGKPPAYQTLVGNHTLTMLSAVNSIRMVMNGGYPPGTSGNPRPYGMPPFAYILSDEEVAAVLTYIRNTWGNHAGVVIPEDVNFYRSAPVN